MSQSYSEGVISTTSVSASGAPPVPAPEPIPPLPTPVPPPIDPGQKWYSSAAFLGWIGGQVVGIGWLIATLLGVPYNYALYETVASAMAAFVAGITTVIFVHNQAQLARDAQAFRAERALRRADIYAMAGQHERALRALDY